MKEYTIGKLAKLLGVNKETIRYYEKVDLLPQPVKKENGYRVYNEQHVEMMEVILIIKESGFTLKEVKEIMTIQEEETALQNNLHKEVILKKIKVIENKIDDLKCLKKGLEKVVFDIENYNIRSCIEIKKKERVD